MGIQKLSLCFISVILSSVVFAQSIDLDSPSKESNTFYNKHIGKSAILYSGPAYVAQQFRMEGSPFLGSDTLTSGWISYDGQYYNNVLLQWDIFQNYVITGSMVSNSKMILRNELIDSFSFAGHLVKYLSSDKENNLMQEGLYDILYIGPSTLMARRIIITRDLMSNNQLVYYMLDKSKHYIRKKGIYYHVSNKKDLAHLFAKEMTEIKRAVRRNKLNWKKDLEQILGIAVVHYDKSTAGK